MQKIALILFCLFSATVSYASEGASSSTAMVPARLMFELRKGSIEFNPVRDKEAILQQRISKREKSLECSVCDKTFVKKYNLRRHMETQHNPEQFEHVEIPDPELVPNKKIKFTPKGFLDPKEYED